MLGTTNTTKAPATFGYRGHFQATKPAEWGLQKNLLGSLYGQAGQFAQAMGQAAQGQSAADQARYTAYGSGIGSYYDAQGQASAAESAGRAAAYGSQASAAGQAQGMGAMAAGQAYGDLGKSYGTLAQAMSNERSNAYGANAMAESARQSALANLGTGAMAAYGGAANNAFQSDAISNAAYMKAMSDMQAAYANTAANAQTARSNTDMAYLNNIGAMHGANQGALGGLGQSRNAAEAALGSAAYGAYGDIGRANVLGSAVGNINFGGGGGNGFTATGTNGMIANGGYTGGGSGGGGGASWGGSGYTAPLPPLSGGITDGGALAALESGYDQGMGQLAQGRPTGDLMGDMNATDAAYRSMLQAVPLNSASGQIGSVLAGLQDLYGAGSGDVNTGMNQFYDAMGNESDYSPVVSGLNTLSGYAGRLGDISQYGNFAPYQGYGGVFTGQGGFQGGPLSGSGGSSNGGKGFGPGSIMDLWKTAYGGTSVPVYKPQPGGGWA